jgi:hypothetical protein
VGSSRPGIPHGVDREGSPSPDGARPSLRSTFHRTDILAPRTWEDGIHCLKRSLTLIQLNWDAVDERGVPCPLTFSPEEINRTEEIAGRWETYDKRVESLCGELEVQVDGRVDVEEFESVKRKSDELRAKWDPVAAGGPYPFQDGGRSFLV